MSHAQQGTIGVSVGIAATGMLVLLMSTDHGDVAPSECAVVSVPEIQKTLPGPPKLVTPDPAPTDPGDPKPAPPPVNDSDPKVVNAQVKQIFDNGALSKKSIDSLVGTSLAGFDAVDRMATARSRDSFDTVGWSSRRSAPKTFDMVPHVEKKYTNDIGTIVGPSRPRPSFELAIVDVTPVAPATSVPGIVTTRVKMYLTRTLSRLEACFATQTATTMTVHFTVASDGRVSVTTPAGDPTAAGCVAREIGSLTLVQPSSTDPVGVVAVLVYRP